MWLSLVQANVTWHWLLVPACIWSLSGELIQNLQAWYRTMNKQTKHSAPLLQALLGLLHSFFYPIMFFIPLISIDPWKASWTSHFKSVNGDTKQWLNHLNKKKWKLTIKVLVMFSCCQGVTVSEKQFGSDFFYSVIYKIASLLSAETKMCVCMSKVYVGHMHVCVWTYVCRSLVCVKVRAHKQAPSSLAFYLGVWIRSLNEPGDSVLAREQKRSPQESPSLLLHSWGYRHTPHSTFFYEFYSSNFMYSYLCSKHCIN